MPKLICMAFDGEYKTEKQFKTVQECWEHSNNIGSRWYFYPFHFVVTDSGKTILDSPYRLENLNRKRVKVICEIFKNLSILPEFNGKDEEGFIQEMQFFI